MHRCCSPVQLRCYAGVSHHDLGDIWNPAPKLPSACDRRIEHPRQPSACFGLLYKNRSIDTQNASCQILCVAGSPVSGSRGRLRGLSFLKINGSLCRRGWRDPAWDRRNILFDKRRDKTRTASQPARWRLLLPLRAFEWSSVFSRRNAVSQCIRQERPVPSPRCSIFIRPLLL